MELEKLSGLELGELVNKKELSPVEVIKYFMIRIQDRNHTINAFTYVMFDEALREAHKQVKMLLEGKSPGPFAGVPMALKDFLDSKKGWSNSHGGVKSLIRTDQYDSMFCKAAESLGAIAIGKTNAPAFGFSGACENKLYGATHNPFNINMTSGGSSGGSAAAVADGLISIAEGGDAGGSIRIPASWCNLFGFKPSLGSVPSVCRPDAWAATHPYCFNGSLTKTVADSVELFQAMAQYNPRDPFSLPFSANKDFKSAMTHIDKSGTRIAFTYDFDLYEHVDPEIKDMLDMMLSKLDSVGVYIEPVEFHFKHSLEEIMYCWAWSISVDTALDLQEWKDQGLDLVKDHRDELPEEFIMFNEIASKTTIWDMRKFNEIRTDILDNLEDVFDNFDYIISPTTICKPLPNEWHGRCIEVDGHKLDPSLNFIAFGETPLLNFVGYPAASVPMGLTSDRLPIGMQIIGKQYKDEDVLSLSHACEVIQPWRDNYRFALNQIAFPEHSY